MQGAVDLGSIHSLREAGAPQFVPSRLIKVPRQERLDLLRNLASGRRAVLEVPRQPSPGIELPQRQRRQDREQRRRQLATPGRARAVEVLPPPPGPAPVVPRRYCPSGSGGRPQTASAPPNARAGSPTPSGTEWPDPPGSVPPPSASSSRPRPGAGSGPLPRTPSRLSGPPGGGP